ncbi:MAG: diaminopimelate decarboxylase [Pseudomonadota bacterium]
MTPFAHRNNELYAEEVRCTELASEFGTPLFVYSRASIEAAWRAFDQALSARDHLICYAVKANSNIAILNLLARLGSGFDIVSKGELERVLAAGGDPQKTVFSGVGKTRGEMVHALDVGIAGFNVESVSELERLNDTAAAHGAVADVSLRINPDVDAKTHPYISTGLKENKFGVPMDAAEAAYLRAAELDNLRVRGVDCHIGSQLTDIAPYLAALERLLALTDALAGHGIAIDHLDLGGGQGIRYHDETPIDLQDWANQISEILGEREFKILVEPGRSIVGNAGVLLTRIEYLKYAEAKNFAVIDAAMNDLLRPSLYSAWHEIAPVRNNSPTPPADFDVVGPVCESSDFLGKSRTLSVDEGDLLAVHSVGAYGFTMSSNYNTRTRAAEVLVDGDQAWLVRERESLADLFAGERCLPE